MAGLNIGKSAPDVPLPKAKHRSKLPSDPKFDVRGALYQPIGIDLTEIHGIGPFWHYASSANAART